MDTSEIKQRTKSALNAIKRALGIEDDEFGATLFVKHHLEEIPQSYWQQHLRCTNPDADAVVGLLELRSNWGEGDLENFDFSLPGEVTDYVISVHFDGAGKVDSISMEGRSNAYTQPFLRQDGTQQAFRRLSFQTLGSSRQNGVALHPLRQ